MKKKRIKTVLCALNYYALKEMRGIAEYARRHDWYLEIPGALYLDRTLRTWSGDGALIDNVGSLAAGLHARGVKITALALFPENLRYADAVVSADNRAIGRCAAEYFLRHGHRRFAVFPDPFGRADAFVETVLRAGFTADKINFEIGNPPFYNSCTILSRMTFPCGVFCCDDQRAAMLLGAARSAGIGVPSELAILGSGNTELFCASSKPMLSSVNTRFFERGLRAAAELDNLMNGGSPPGNPVIIEPLDVVERGSSDFYAVDDPLVSEMIAFLRENATRDVTISEMRSRFFRTESAIYRAFRRTLGISPKDFLTEVRMNLAKTHLLSSSDKLESVASDCGFPNPKAMFTAFRRFCGRTPDQWRKENSDCAPPTD